MKKAIILIGFLTAYFYASAQNQQQLSSNDKWAKTQKQQASIDTTVLQPTMFFSEKESPSYHLKKAGANITAAVITGVFGGLTTGLCAAIEIEGAKKTKGGNTNPIKYTYIAGGVTAITALICTIIAGTELQAAGKSMDKIQINSNGVVINF